MRLSRIASEASVDLRERVRLGTLVASLAGTMIGVGGLGGCNGCGQGSRPAELTASSAEPVREVPGMKRAELIRQSGGTPGRSLRTFDASTAAPP